MKKITLILFALLMFPDVCISSTEAYPLCVTEKKGDIYLKTNNKEVRLTNTGLNKSPVIHPSGEWVYYVIGTGAIDIGDMGSVGPPKGYKGSYVLKEEIWKMDTKGERKSFVYKSPKNPEVNQTWYTLSSIDNLQFSPDGKKVYFETNKWATSNALHVMESNGSKAKMLGPGNGLKIIKSTNFKQGEYIGYLVLSQHLYFTLGGSYDWYWLFDPGFKEIGPIGDNIPEDLSFIDQTVWNPISDKGIMNEGGQTKINDIKSMIDLTVGKEYNIPPRKALPTIPSDNLKAGQLWIDPVTDMEFVWVPKGCYQMGSNSRDSQDTERPVHEACVDGFWIGKYEVTQGQWKKIMDDNPSRFKTGDNYPVERLSWNDAKTFISKLNSRSGHTFRLPTEAEWEYAARSGGKDEEYSGGNDPSLVGWYLYNSKKIHPGGEKAPNGLGVYDMSGNVREFCEDIYNVEAYSDHSRINPLNTSDGGLGITLHVVRGGCIGGGLGYTRVADRRADLGGTSQYTGFRLVKIDTNANKVSDAELTSRQIEIIQTVLNRDGYISKELHSEFWELMPVEVKDDKEALNAMVYFIEKTFVFAMQFVREGFASVKASLEAGRVVKTPGYESARNKFYTSVPQQARQKIQESIDNTEGMITAAAGGKPFNSNRGTMYITPDEVNHILSGLDSSFFRARRLINPEWETSN